jgi:putative ABC transport system permease protein
VSARIATLRLARRELLRHRWRSLLIVLLILVPVAAGTCFDIVWRTSNSRQMLEEEVFGGADAIIGRQVGQSHKFVTDEQIFGALPPGSREVGQSIYGGVTLSASGHQTYSYLIVTDRLDDPLLRNRAQLASGRAPVAADEAAITPGVADRLGLLRHGRLRPGATIAYAPPPRLLSGPVPANAAGSRATVPAPPASSAPSKVVGLLREPFCLDCSLTVIPSSSRLDATESHSGAARFLVLLPPEYRGAHGRPLTALTALGVPVTRRDDVGIRQLLPLDSPGPSRAHLEAVATGILVGGFGLLEITLLGGTAFAVGARRQDRELGLLAGQGASPRDLRRVVLAQGLLLAGLGSAGGIAVGFAADRALRGVIEEQTNQVVIGTHFGWIELGLAGAVGVFSGLAAAVPPAFAASRRPVTDALRARFSVTAQRSRWRPMVGTALTTVAPITAWAASVHARRLGVCYYRGQADGRDLPEGASCPQLPDHFRDTVSIVAAVFIGVTGLLLLMPAALAVVARIARILPATTRMAARDTARHCHRTGPATVAIAMAVCAAVSLACLIDSGHEKPWEHLFATAPPHTLSMSVITQFGEDPATLAPAIGAAVAQLPGARVIPMTGVTGGPHNYNGVVVSPSPDGTQAGVAVGTPDLVLLASGRTADRAVVTAALDSGKAIVFDPYSVEPDGTVNLSAPSPYAPGVKVPTVSVPALRLSRPKDYGGVPSAYVSAAVLAAHGWVASDADGVLIDYPAASASHAAAALQAAQAALSGYAYAPDAEATSDRLLRNASAGAAALAGLAGVLICVALSAAEGRPDLATLAAIGAPPGRGRRLGGAQALLPALLGTLVGLALGFGLAFAARPAATTNDRTLIPWMDLLAIVAAVPVLAALVGILGSLPRPVLTRRAD